MKRLAVLAALAGVVGFSGAAMAEDLVAIPPANTFASYGECISAYNNVSKQNFGTPGKNTYVAPGGTEPLSASERAQAQKQDREAYCASLKNKSAKN